MVSGSQNITISNHKWVGGKKSGKMGNIICELDRFAYQKLVAFCTTF